MRGPLKPFPSTISKLESRTGNGKVRSDEEVSEEASPDSSSSLCEDVFSLKQVADSVKTKIRQRLSEACGSSDGLSCDVEDLEAICEEVGLDVMQETNRIISKRRGKRGELIFQIY